MELRKIIHIDMDAYYASIEQRDNPEYRGKAIAVGWSGDRGIVTTASYEARKYGVRSAMPSKKARKLCPHLIFIPSRMEVYKSVSIQIHTIFNRYTDIVEPLSLDEAFLDVTSNKLNIELAVEIAKKIKEDIKNELGLIASAGISYNKFLAKIASDFRKPDGLYIIHPNKAQDFIARLPIESFWGVGKVTAIRMHALGIHNGAQLRECALDFLLRNFGKAGKLYSDFAHGIDPRQVEPERIRKSVGCESTFEKDISGYSPIWEEFQLIAEDLVKRIERSGFRGHTFTLKFKFDDFSVKTKSFSISYEIISKEEILSLTEKLLKETDVESKKIRLLGLSVSNPREEIHPNLPIQLSFDF
ncbi:MAG: DNA polymerase IV [Odoribacter sp.]|nr:DNA polymerase IV [Odoribacter sp.]